MYESFFGFKEKPFNITPDPRFLYLSAQHREALAQLIYGVQERKGFVVLSGGVGTGKTTLVRALLERLDDNCQVAYLFNPKLSVVSFLKYACQDLGSKIKARSKADYLAKLEDFLIDSFNQGKTTTLIVDEAQNLDPELFEEIRLLTNLETTSQKLLQIFLVGQPELVDLLEQSELRQLKQRISVRYHLLPLSCEETTEYIHTRMSIAGAKNLDCFTEGAIREIYEYSRGIPRLINNICDNSLLIGYATETSIIDGKIVRESVADLKLELPINYRIHRRIMDGLSRHKSAYAAVAIVLAGLLAAGIGLFLSSRGPAPPSAMEPQLQSEKKPPMTETIPISGSEEEPLNSETGSMGGFEEEVVAGAEEADISQIPDDAQRMEFRTVLAGQGDTVHRILLREFGRVDTRLLEAVERLNPEIEDLDRISVRQEIRLPGDSGEPIGEP